MSQCFAVKGIGGADQATLGSAEILVKYAQLADKRARVYVLVSTWLVVWGIWHVYFVEAVFRMPSCGCIITRPAMNSGLYVAGWAVN